jgi:GDP-L-fucose synthase
MNSPLNPNVPPAPALGGINEAFYRGKNILVTGGTGTIGPIIVRRLLAAGAHVSVVSLDSEARARAVLPEGASFQRADLRDGATCQQISRGREMVLHLMAIKGSTQLGVSRVASAYVPFLLCNTNMMEAAFRQGVERYLFVGSIGQYPAKPLRHEDEVWDGPPQANDRFMGVAKRAGEMQAEAYWLEHGWSAPRLVRLANVYGPYDDFDRKTGHVIPALISRIADGENPVAIAGDGSAQRDFIYSEDVAEGMLIALEKAPPCVAVNLGSGQGASIRTVAETIARQMPHPPELQFDAAGAVGDAVRVLAVERARNLLGFTASTSLESGIHKTLAWYQNHQTLAKSRHIYG